ncbi:MAG: RDD family protein [Deltaproteobacteria bacterium]|nr:RDD family protein [Candidatus Zymogenaceae bacterium]
MSSKADVLHRLLAKLIDALLVGAACLVLYPVGVMIGATYIIIADGLFEGRSIGKYIIGLRVIREEDGEEATFTDSFIRNALFGLIVLFGVVPFLRWLLILSVGLLIVLFETYYVVATADGRRVGDLAAGTLVVDAPRKKRETGKEETPPPAKRAQKPPGGPGKKTSKSA